MPHQSKNIFILASLLIFVGACSKASKNQAEVSEQTIDIGTKALSLGKEIDPRVDVAAYSAQLDALARETLTLAKNSSDPETRVRALNTVLFRNHHFRADPNSVTDRRPERYFLHHVLETREGNCFSMPLLYVAVAQRLGWPIYLVHVPDHSFVRYVDPRLKEQNIETTSGGGYVQDETYTRDFHVSEKGRQTGAYLRSISYRELGGDLLAVNAINIGQKGNLLKALEDLTRATQESPLGVGIWSNRHNAHKLLAKRLTGVEAEQHLKQAAFCAEKLKELGFVHPKDVPPITSKNTQAK